MNVYLWLKWLHIVSATVLFGTGAGIAFFKWTADRSRDVRVIRVVNERIVLADWIFTSPAGVIQPVSGVGLALLAGYPLTSTWLAVALGLYVIAGVCWFVVVWLQLRMRDLAVEADKAQSALPVQYWRLARAWFWLGVPAFMALLVIYALMVFKPA